MYERCFWVYPKKKQLKEQGGSKGWRMINLSWFRRREKKSSWQEKDQCFTNIATTTTLLHNYSYSSFVCGSLWLLSFLDLSNISCNESSSDKQRYLPHLPEFVVCCDFDDAFSCFAMVCPVLVAVVLWPCYRLISLLIFQRPGNYMYDVCMCAIRLSYFGCFFQTCTRSLQYYLRFLHVTRMDVLLLM